MTHQQRDAVVFLLQARRERRGFFGRHAEPVHAGIDMDRRAAAPALAATKASHSASSTMLLMTGCTLSSANASPPRAKSR